MTYQSEHGFNTADIDQSVKDYPPIKNVPLAWAPELESDIFEHTRFQNTQSVRSAEVALKSVQRCIASASTGHDAQCIQCCIVAASRCNLAHRVKAIEWNLRVPYVSKGWNSWGPTTSLRKISVQISSTPATKWKTRTCEPQIQASVRHWQPFLWKRSLRVSGPRRYDHSVDPSLPKWILKIVHWNAQGCNEKLSIIQQTVLEEDNAVLCLQETRLQVNKNVPSRSKLIIKSYKIHHFPKGDNHGILMPVFAHLWGQCHERFGYIDDTFLAANTYEDAVVSYSKLALTLDNLGFCYSWDVSPRTKTNRLFS